MDYKIEGRFLKIDQIDQKHFRVWWTDIENKPHYIDMDTTHMLLNANGASNSIGYYQRQSALAKTEREKRSNQSLLLRYTFEAIWPEMFVAHNRGLSMKRFFEIPKSGTGKTRKKLWKGNKSEFCQHIKHEYEANPSLYESERDATVKIFSRFRFSDKGWTQQKCYSLLKKL